jgi:hypothetical protein
VHNGIVTNDDLGHVIEADTLDDAAKVYTSDADHAVGRDLFYPARYR